MASLTDDELAAVMGHEIAHALREHSREQMSRAYAIQMGENLGGALLGVGQGGMQLADQVSQVALTLPFSRGNENEADLIGLELSARAGYNPNAAITLWRKMAQASQGITDAVVGKAVTTGYGRLDNDVLTSVMEIKNGKVTMNGKEVAMPGVPPAGANGAVFNLTVPTGPRAI